MSHRLSYWLFAASLSLTITAPGRAQSKDTTPSASQSKPKEAEPPEEDDSAKPKEYAFNPLQAEKEVSVGEFYLKKGSLVAAIARFTEATKWNPGYAEAYLKLGEANEKFKDKKAAKEAYTKYLELAPDAKNAHEVKKKLSKL